MALLRLFLASPRKVLTRDDIIAAAPAENADAFDRSIDSRIVRLRRKLDTETITTISCSMPSGLKVAKPLEYSFHSRAKMRKLRADKDDLGVVRLRHRAVEQFEAVMEQQHEFSAGVHQFQGLRGTVVRLWG